MLTIDSAHPVPEVCGGEWLQNGPDWTSGGAAVCPSDTIVCRNTAWRLADGGRAAVKGGFPKTSLLIIVRACYQQSAGRRGAAPWLLTAISTTGRGRIRGQEIRF